MTACSKSAFWQTLPRVYGQAALKRQLTKFLLLSRIPRTCGVSWSARPIVELCFPIGGATRMRQLLGLATPLKFLSTGLCGGNDLNCALHGDNARKLAAEPLFATRQHC